MKIKIEYYGYLIEAFNCREEYLETDEITLTDLFQQQCIKYNITCDIQNIRAAINDEFAEWTDFCHNGDTIAFLPPATGG